MKSVIAIVSGPNNWFEKYMDIPIVHYRIYSTRWYSENGVLFAIKDGIIFAILGVIWRLGPVRPENSHRAILELIKNTGTPCVNSADTLLKGYDRLSMLNELKGIGLPVVKFNTYIGDNLLWGVRRQFPFVIKFGNYHGGYGKALVKNEDQWRDLIDISYTINDYITIEEYVECKRDLRCLLIGNDVYCTEREGINWKINHITTKSEIIEPLPKLVEYTKKVKEHLKADIIGWIF